MLHGAVAWLVAVPLLLAAGALGAGSFFGGWYGGLAGTPAWAPPAATATAESALTPEQAAAVTRNTALGAVSALLLGLIGSVLGG
jgi:hypothetical protein